MQPTISLSSVCEQRILTNVIDAWKKILAMFIGAWSIIVRRRGA